LAFSLIRLNNSLLNLRGVCIFSDSPDICIILYKIFYQRYENNTMLYKQYDCVFIVLNHQFLRL
jgi:hypothetical protein